MNPVARISLMVAYAILALAATGRSSVQLATKFAEAPLPYALSATSAVLYAVIAIALFRGSAGARRVALIGTVVELAGVVTVGTLGWAAPGWWTDETVWSGYGSGYGWVPLALPVVALWFLLRARGDGQ